MSQACGGCWMPCWPGTPCDVALPAAMHCPWHTASGAAGTESTAHVYTPKPLPAAQTPCSGRYTAVTTAAVTWLLPAGLLLLLLLLLCCHLSAHIARKSPLLGTHQRPAAETASSRTRTDTCGAWGHGHGLSSLTNGVVCCLAATLSAAIML